MSIATYIVNKDVPFKVCKLFQNRVRHLSNYLIKTVGVNHKEKERCLDRKIKEGKRHVKTMKTSVYHHMLRKVKVN